MSLPLRGTRFIVQYGVQNTACVHRRPFRRSESLHLMEVARYC